MNRKAKGGEKKPLKISIEGAEVEAQFVQGENGNWSMAIQDLLKDQNLQRDTDAIGVGATLALFVAHGELREDIESELDDECAHLFEGVDGALRLIP